VKAQTAPADTLCGIPGGPHPISRGEHTVILHGRSSTGLRRAAVIGAAVLVPVLAGCEAGNNAPTTQWHQPTAGASTVIDSGASGQIAIRNVFVLGAADSGPLPVGSSAGLYLALVNTGSPDRLVSVSAPGTATSVLLPSKTGVRLRENSEVLLTGPAPGVVLDGLTRSLNSGEDIRVTLDFQNAGQVTLAVPVMPRTDYYATFSPAPANPTATPTVSAKVSPKATGTPAASATPSPSATS
jgi:copper(I)-binding protein